MKVEIEEKSSESKLIALAVSERLRQLIRKEAFEKELSVSATIRLILENYFRDRQ